MDLKNEKCVMVVDSELPAGLLTNAAAIMGITLGKLLPEIVGADVSDGEDRIHRGIIEFPVPILKGSAELLRELRERLYEPEFQEVTAVDFTELAQSCRTYEEYTEKMAGTHREELTYLGIAICGAKKKVNRLTGSMPLLRRTR